MYYKIVIKTLCIIGLLFNAAITQELTADEIVDKINNLINQEYVKSVLTMTITTSSGKERTFEYEAYSKNSGEKNLMKYLSPARVKGQTILMLNNADDIWAYFPKTNRVRKLAAHAKKQKMQGSDFSYEDMGSGDAWITDFSSELIGDEKIEGTDCYIIKLLKKPEVESGYSKQVMRVRKDNFYPIQIDYYDEDDSDYNIKRLVLSDIKDIEGIPTAMKMVMHNLEDNSETVMEYKQVTYNEELPDDMFTERGMKK